MGCVVPLGCFLSWLVPVPRMWAFLFCFLWFPLPRLWAGFGLILLYLGCGFGFLWLFCMLALSAGSGLLLVVFCVVVLLIPPSGGKAFAFSPVLLGFDGACAISLGFLVVLFRADAPFLVSRGGAVRFSIFLGALGFL